jgi:hypothetical protein
LETSKNEINVNSKRLEAFQNALNEINNEEEESNESEDIDEEEDEEEEEEEEEEEHEEDDDEEHTIVHDQNGSSNISEQQYKQNNRHDLTIDQYHSEHLKQQNNLSNEIMSKMNRNKIQKYVCLSYRILFFPLN